MEEIEVEESSPCKDLMETEGGNQINQQVRREEGEQ